MVAAVLIVVSVALALMRLAGSKGQAFQAAAHIWVGALIALIAVGHGLWPLEAWLLGSLTVVEVAAFLYFRGLNRGSHGDV